MMALTQVICIKEHWAINLTDHISQALLFLITTNVNIMEAG